MRGRSLREDAVFRHGIARQNRQGRQNAAIMQHHPSDPRLRDCEFDNLAAIIDAPEFEAFTEPWDGEPGPDFWRSLFAEHVQHCLRCQWVRERVKLEEIPELDEHGNIVD
jgi:hypothetical protein